MRNKEYVSNCLDQAYIMLLTMQQDIDSGRLVAPQQLATRLHTIAEKVSAASKRVQLEHDEF